MDTIPALQDFFPNMTCFGCGPANRTGLRIKSFWSDDAAEVICSWKARAPHSSGMPNVAQGGILATLIDCHSIWTAIAWAYRQEDRAFGSEPMPGYVTGTLREIKFLRPTPMDATLLLRARVIEHAERKSIVHCSIYAHEHECVKGEVIAIRLPESKYIR